MRKLGTNKKLKFGILLLESGICKGRIRNPAPEIHGVESRMKYCPGLPYIGRFFDYIDDCVAIALTAVWRLRS